MKYFSCLLLSAAAALASNVGDTYQQVIAEKGNPKSQIEAGESPSLIGVTVDKIDGLLNAIGTGYLRAGAAYTMYPFA